MNHLPSEVTLMEHLTEIRNRVLRIVIAIVVIFVLLLSVADSLYSFLAQPLLSALPDNSALIATGTLSPFMVQVKLAFYVSVLVLTPYILFEIWGFLAPALYKHEKKMFIPLFIASCIFFILGMAFCYFVVLPMLTHFMASHVPTGVAYQPDIADYLSTSLGLMLTFGLTFELPVVVVLLAVLGIVDYETLANSRRYVIVGIFVVAAVATPPDILSQLMLAIPMVVFYEIALLVVKLIHKNNKKLIDTVT